MDYKQIYEKIIGIDPTIRLGACLPVVEIL